MDEFEALYREHFTAVYQYALSLCRDGPTAEEITQATFYRAMESIDTFRGECRVFVWLCQIARNQYYSLCRKRRRFIDTPIPENAGPDIAASLLDRENVDRLHRLLHELREPYKEVFTLRVFGELSFSRIGELFGKTDSWARLIYYRAKNELRRQMDE